MTGRTGCSGLSASSLSACCYATATAIGYRTTTALSRSRRGELNVPDDIVTRLRAGRPSAVYDIAQHAADEIERLTARCESLERQLIDAEIRYATRLPL